MHRWLLLGWLFLRWLLLRWLLLAASWMAAYFESVKKCWLFCWLWASQKTTLQHNSLRRSCMPEQLSGLLLHVTNTPPRLLKLVKVSISSELYPDCFLLSVFLDCSGIQFFDSPPTRSFFLTQSVRLPLVIYLSLCSAYVTYIPCQQSPGASRPTLT